MTHRLNDPRYANIFSTFANLTTSRQSVLRNNNELYQIYKIKDIKLVNSTASSATASVIFRRNTTDIFIVKDVVVGARSTLPILTKETEIYLEYNDIIVAQASANSAITMSMVYKVDGFFTTDHIRTILAA